MITWIIRHIVLDLAHVKREALLECSSGTRIAKLPLAIKREVRQYAM